MNKPFKMTKELAERIENIVHSMHINEEDLSSYEVPLLGLLEMMVGIYNESQGALNGLAKRRAQIQNMEKVVQRLESISISYESVLTSQYGDTTIQNFIERMEKKKQEELDKQEIASPKVCKNNIDCECEICETSN